LEFVYRANALFVKIKSSIKMQTMTFSLASYFLVALSNVINDKTDDVSNFFIF
jgi:hypothetical protein